MKKLLLFCLVFGACHQIHDGIVTDKYIVPAHSYQYPTMIMVGKVPITTWNTRYVDDEYVLTVTKITGKDTISEDFSVNASTYECKIAGDYFNDSIPCEVYEPK